MELRKIYEYIYAMNEKRIQQHKKVLMYLSLGKRSKDIGELMGISDRTVEKHIEILKAAHGAKNVTHLVAIALRNQIIK